MYEKVTFSALKVTFTILKTTFSRLKKTGQWAWSMGQGARSIGSRNATEMGQEPAVCRNVRASVATFTCEKWGRVLAV